MRFLKALILIALLPSLAFATPTDQYVNCACGTNGDGTSASCTEGGAGTPGAFSTFANWEGQNSTLTTAMVVHFSGTCTAASTLAGWTTSGANTLTLDGLTIATTDYNAVLSVDQNYVILNNFTGSKTSGTVKIQVLDVTATAATFTLKKSKLFNGSGVTRDSGNAVLQIASVASGTRTIYDNVIYGSKQDGINYSTANGETANLYNNTVYGSTGAGIALAVDANTATWNLKNNLASNNTGGDYSVSPGGSTVYNHATNLSSDTTSPEVSLRSKTVSFVNTGTNDYHLQSGDTSAKDAGTDLSATFTTDYDGDTFGTWDIGFDEPGAGGGGGGSAVLNVNNADASGWTWRDSEGGSQ